MELFPNNEVKKDNLSLNLNTSLSEKLKADAVFNYVHTTNFNIPEQGYGNNSVAQKVLSMRAKTVLFGCSKDIN